MRNPQNLGKSVKSIRPYFIFFKNFSVSPFNDTNITNDFISIFTKKPFCPNQSELEALAPMLNAAVVETVLNGFKSWRIAYMFFTWASNQHGYKHNMYTYNAMAAILSRARQNAQLRDLSIDILKCRCSMSPGALGFLLRCLGSAGLADEANLLFDQAGKMSLCLPNNYTYNCLLEANCRSGSVDLVEMRLKEMRDYGFEFSKYTLTPVLQVYCNAGKYDKALDVFNEIDNNGWADDYVFSILVLSFSKWGAVDKAFELVERMESRNVRLNGKTLCVLIHGFVKASRVDKALPLFNKMKNYGFSPDASLYDVLIGGLCRIKELEKALCLYSEMKELEIQPDVGIISKLISSFSEEGKLPCLLEEIREEMDVEAMILLYNSVLNSLVNNGSVDKAYHLLQAMMGDNCDDDEINKFFMGKEMVPPNATSFSIVINGLLKAAKLDMALILFHDMARIGCKRDLILFNNLIDGLCSSNRLEESYELLQEMEELGFEPTHFTHNSIFGCLCRRKDVSGVLDLVKKMRIHGHDPWIKHSTFLVKELCKHGKVVEACKFLDDMVLEGFIPDIVAYTAALDGLVKMQGVDHALKLFQDICARGYCPDVVAYNTVINGLCKAQRIAEAQNLLNEIVAKGLVPSVVTYNLLIDGWCKTDHIDKAVLCLSTMFDKEISPNAITYTTLIDGLCKVGRPDDAIKLWIEMQGKGCAPNRVAFMAFIHGLCKCGRPNSALVHFHEMEVKGMKPDNFVYMALVSAFLADLNLPSAFEILKMMVQEGNFPDPSDKNYTIVRDAICQLSEDSRTSSSVKDLIAEGKIPMISLSDIGGESEVDPTS